MDIFTLLLCQVVSSKCYVWFISQRDTYRAPAPHGSCIDYTTKENTEKNAFLDDISTVKYSVPVSRLVDMCIYIRIFTSMDMVHDFVKPLCKKKPLYNIIMP